MRVTVDTRAGAAYIYLAGDKIRAAATTSAATDINLDFDVDGRLIGVELLNLDLLHPDLIAIAEDITKP